MKLSHMLLAAAAPFALALPAHADQYVKAVFSGQVLGVNADAPGSIAVGTTITWQAVYDQNKLTDYTTSLNDATGLGFASAFFATLANDPGASLSIKVGDITFTDKDEVNYGTPEGDCGPGCDLGGGNFPAVTFLNGSFAGVSNMFANAQGYVIDADPVADAFGGFDLGDQSTGGFQFFIGRGDVDNPFGDVVAVGSYDAASVTFTPVPEPAAWSLMILGFGGLGVALRRRPVPFAA